MGARLRLAQIPHVQPAVAVGASMQTESDYARLKAAFLEMLDLAPEARLARMQDIEAESPTLAESVRRQLAAAGQRLALLDNSGVAPVAPKLSQYRMVRELGRGGMGVVWLAERQLGDASQHVAVKQIARSKWTQEDLQRFQRERRILASLDHPNIATLLDGGADEYGEAYLTTQYVDGERLDRWCETQGLGLRARLMLMRQITGAVVHAHSRLVVHRDLKPANILVTRDGTPKLLDFGIARVLQEEALTSEGSSQMTLRYAAPEQVAESGENGSVSVDIYALGVILYELLAGQSPYGQLSTPSALIHAILHTELAPPSRATSAIAGIDADLDAVCLKALRKRPDQRYTSASDLLADLDRWLAREPVAARRGERGYRLRSFIRRRWPWLAAASITACAIGYHLWVQQEQMLRLEQQRDKAQALADYFGELFSGANPTETQRGDISARELLERSVKQITSDQQRPPAVRAALLLASTNALNFLGQTKPAHAAAKQAMAIALTLDPPDPDLLAVAHSEYAGMLAKTGDNASAQREAQAGVRLFELGLAHDQERYQTLQQQLAMFAETAGDREGARAAYEAIATSARHELNRREAMERFLAAQANLATGELSLDPKRAEDRLRDALAQANAYGFSDPASLVPMQTYLASALYNQRKLREAHDVMAPTLVSARAFYTAQDPWLGMVVGIAGNVAALNGDFENADALLLEGGKIAALSFGPNHPNTRSSQADRAVLSVLAGNFAQAEQRLDVILEWLVANGKAEGKLTKFLHGAQAYVRARRDPSAEKIAAALEVLQDRSSWGSGRSLWLSNDWVAWLELARRRP